MLGTVVHYNRLASYGFITPDDPTLPDHFVCATFINADKPRRFLTVGQRVEFDPVDTDTTKPQARNVRILPTTIAIQRSAPVAEGGHA